MMGWLGSAYPWVKAAHVIFVIFWMAGLFMLPRFLVYHQEDGLDGAMAARWIEREKKLRQIILTPSSIVVWALGLMLAAHLGLFSGSAGLGWLHAKFALVVLLTGYHHWATSYSKRLARGEVRLTGKQLRLANEVPGIAAILIVLLVVAQPF
ncbi:CopD family protein [Sphingomonas sp.]|uniref:CopD family protein n=1 Tax=Sphingomonas sp. TaxID=28214 RepID=UPI001D1CA4E2|nr:CopD family protein [Sphingomonas sp.]MBX9795514.1 CopD family protein [Sphingomonas sp.]